MIPQDCRARATMLGSYLDGELEASKLLEMDEHVEGCEACREGVLLLGAMRGSLKEIVRSPAPDGLRNRIEKTHQSRCLHRCSARLSFIYPLQQALVVPLVGCVHGVKQVGGVELFQS